jgi:predicted DNA-binding transcriptional regulator YafY
VRPLWSVPPATWLQTPPLIFTEDESLALTLSLLVAREHGLAQTSPAFQGVLAKVKRVLPEATRARIQAVEQTVLFESSSSYAAPSVLAVTTLSSAIQTGQCVRLQFHSARANVSERVFDPYGVVYHEGFWYTIGYCHLRQDQRLFRLDRILHIEVTSETFPTRQTLMRSKRCNVRSPLFQERGRSKCGLKRR